MPRQMSKAAFVALVSANQPEMPPYFVYAAERKRWQRPTITQPLERTLTPLTLEHLCACCPLGPRSWMHVSQACTRHGNGGLPAKANRTAPCSAWLSRVQRHAAWTCGAR
jgi:hypothetical protein